VRARGAGKAIHIPTEKGKAMSALEVVIIIVAVVTAAYLAFAALGMVQRPARSRRGVAWIDHPEDHPIAERPSESAVPPRLSGREAIRPH
jgi:hypothetical protein